MCFLDFPPSIFKDLVIIELFAFVVVFLFDVLFPSAYYWKLFCAMLVFV